MFSLGRRCEDDDWRGRTLYEFIDRDATAEVESTRRVLNDWFGHLPSGDAEEWLGRFRANDARAALAAFWERQASSPSITASTMGLWTACPAPGHHSPTTARIALEPCQSCLDQAFQSSAEYPNIQAIQPMSSSPSNHTPDVSWRTPLRAAPKATLANDLLTAAPTPRDAPRQQPQPDRQSAGRSPHTSRTLNASQGFHQPRGFRLVQGRGQTPNSRRRPDLTLQVYE
jgi:hypothetical protein